MSNYSTSTFTAKSVTTIDDMLAAIKKIESIPKGTDYTLITLDGAAYKGTFDQIFSLLASRHPVMQQLSYKDFLMDGGAK